MELDFEKPIVELEVKLEEMRAMSTEGDEDMNTAIEALENKLKTLIIITEYDWKLY